MAVQDGISRRSLLAGSTLLAAGSAAVAAAGASADEGATFVLAELAEHVSPGVVEVVALDTDVRIRVEVLPGARLVRRGRPAELSDFEVGETVAVSTASGRGGVVHARSLVTCVLGRAQRG